MERNKDARNRKGNKDIMEFKKGKMGKKELKREEGRKAGRKVF